MSGPLKAAGAISQGIAAKRMGKYNKEVADRSARQTEIETSQIEAQIRRDVRATQGEAIAAMGASGFSLDSSSNLDALRESAINGQLDILNVQRKGRLQAESARSGGALALMQGKAAQIGSFIQAGAEIAKTAEKAFGGGG